MGARQPNVPLAIWLAVIAAIAIGLAGWAFHAWPAPTNREPQHTPTLTPPTTPAVSTPAPLRSSRPLICPPRTTHTLPRITLSTYPDVPTLSDPDWPGFDVFVDVEAGKVVRITYTRKDGACIPQKETEEPDLISRVLLHVFPVGEDTPIVKELLLNIQPPYGVDAWDGGYHVVPKNAGTFEVKVRAHTAKGQVAEAETRVVVYETVIQATPASTPEAQRP